MGDWSDCADIHSVSAGISLLRADICSASAGIPLFRADIRLHLLIYLQSFYSIYTCLKARYEGSTTV